LGSANLTGTALGWVPNPNIELLTAVAPDAVAQVEQRLSLESMKATPELAAEVDEIAKGLHMPGFVSVSPLREAVESTGIWFPRLRIPGDLSLAYSRGLESLASRSSAAAAVDLEVLDLPQGLSKEQFYLIVGHRLRQQPLVASIDGYLERPRRFGEVRDKIEQLTGISHDAASDAWQTLMRWLLEFLPERYILSVPRHSELFGRRRNEMEMTR
jgi:hypothetical protein